MGTTDKIFGKQPSTGDRVKQAIWWFCILPQAIAGWLVFFRYFDLFFNGGEVGMMQEMDRFWLHTGIGVMYVILAVQIIFVWTLRSAYHRVEHVKETRIIHEAAEYVPQPDMMLDTWVTHNDADGRTSQTAIIKEPYDITRLVEKLNNEPPKNSKHVSDIMKEMKRQCDIEKEPYKRIYGQLLNMRKKLESRENKARKDKISSPSPLNLVTTD